MHKPQRMCVVCRTRHNKEDLIRISKFDDVPVIDQDKKQSSRAIYVCKNANCVEFLKKNKAIERFLKVESNQQIFDEIESLLK